MEYVINRKSTIQAQEALKVLSWLHECEWGDKIELESLYWKIFYIHTLLRSRMHI